MHAPCAHPSRHSGGAQRHPKAGGGTPQEVTGHLSRSNVMLFCGDSRPRGKTTTHYTQKRLRITRRSSVVLGSGGATLYLTDRERCSEAYYFIALPRLPGDRDFLGQGRGSQGLFLISECSPTPPCPSRPFFPPRLAPPARVGHLKKYTRRPP